jgi:hypothetical protein
VQGRLRFGSRCRVVFPVGWCRGMLFSATGSGWLSWTGGHPTGHGTCGSGRRVISAYHDYSPVVRGQKAKEVVQESFYEADRVTSP